MHRICQVTAAHGIDEVDLRSVLGIPTAFGDDITRRWKIWKNVKPNLYYSPTKRGQKGEQGREKGR